MVEMAHVVALVAGLLMLADAQAGDMAERTIHQGFLSKYTGSSASQTSPGDYTKFMPAWSNHMRHGGSSDALYRHNGPAIKDSQQVDANGNYGGMNALTVFNKPTL